LGERLELDPALLVEAVGGVDETDDAILDQVANVDGVGHGRRHPARERFNERQTFYDTLARAWCGERHRFLLQGRAHQGLTARPQRNPGTKPCLGPTGSARPVSWNPVTACTCGV